MELGGRNTHPGCQNGSLGLVDGNHATPRSDENGGVDSVPAAYFKMTECSYDGHFLGLQAEIAAPTICAKPNHSVPVDLQYLERLTYVGPQSNLILSG